MFMRKGFRRSAAILLGCSVVGLMTARLPAAEPGAAASDAPAEQPKDEMDKLLNMDINELSNVSVSEINPIIEGVSKKEETLSESPGIVDVITARDIEQFGAKNLYEVLERATSLYMTGSFLFPRNVASIRSEE